MGPAELRLVLLHTGECHGVVANVLHCRLGHHRLRHCGYPYAYADDRSRPKMRLALIMCVLVPFWVSGVVRTLAWVILLQDSGVINSTIKAIGFSSIKLIRTPAGVIIGMAQVLMPFMILPLYSVMRGIDLRLVLAARSLGARPVLAFLQVYLPLSLPGVFAGAHHRLHPGARLLHHAGPARRTSQHHAFDTCAEPGAEFA